MSLLNPCKLCGAPARRIDVAPDCSMHSGWVIVKCTQCSNQLKIEPGEMTHVRGVIGETGWEWNGRQLGAAREEAQRRWNILNSRGEAPFIESADGSRTTFDIFIPEAPNYTLRHISNLNLVRCLRWHPEGLNSWSLSDWGVALAGEVGEACDVIKKLNRFRDGLVGNKIGVEVLHANLAKELADVYLYLDLIAQAAGIDLPSAIRQKFNEVSERNNFPERLE